MEGEGWGLGGIEPVAPGKARLEPAKTRKQTAHETQDLVKTAQMHRLRIST